MKPTKALLVIDMQKGSFTPKTPRFDTEGVVARINSLATLFRQKGWPVVIVQHDGTGTGEFEKNNWDWGLLDELQTEPSDTLLDKYANDVFYRSKLQELLTAWGTQELLITGCATDFCVEATVQSALAKDYNITVVADGHTTGDRPHLPAQKVIEHYNWVWQNMIPTKGNIRVEDFETISKTIKNKLLVKSTRKHVLEILELWASKDKQLDYQTNVPIAQVSAELFCQWADDIYYPESTRFREAFNEIEMEVLADFNNVLNEASENTPPDLPNISEFIQTKEWSLVNLAAIEALKKIK